MSQRPLVQFVNGMDRKLWDEIDPAKGRALRKTNVDMATTKKVKTETESDKEQKQEAIKPNGKAKKEMPTKEHITSMSTFLVPIYITGEKQDYQLWYCINAIKTALKFASTTLRKDGFAQLYMVGMKSKLNWEEIKSNSSPYADVISSILLKSGAICMVDANRTEEIKKVYSSDAPFIVLLSATDIATPCRGNQCVGTGWIVFRRTRQSRVKGLLDREIFKCTGRKVHAGVLINGCSTSVIMAFKKKKGIHHFIFDCRIGDFILFEEEHYIRTAGNAVSYNEGLFFKFDKEIQNWLKGRKNCEQPEEEYYSRYTGGRFTDGYKVLLSGGLYMSPRETGTNFKQGRIKLLYEALPLAYLTEKAGGRATDGNFPILKKRSFTRSQLTHLFMGSLDDVNNVLEVVKEETERHRCLSKHLCHHTDESSTDYDL